MKKIIITTAISSILVACSFGPKLPSQVAPEAELYQQHCGSCHDPVPAEMFQAFQWERLLTLLERGLELSHQEIAQPITSEEKEILLNYLKQYAKPDEDSTAEQLREQLRDIRHQQQ